MGKQLPSRRDPDDEDDEGSKVDRTSSSDWESFGCERDQGLSATSGLLVAPSGQAVGQSAAASVDSSG